MQAYNIFDFKAVVKHAYHATKDSDSIYCDETDRNFATWESAAQYFLERFTQPLFEEGSPRELLIAHDMGHDYRSNIYEPYKQKRKTREKSQVEVEQVKRMLEWVKKFFSAIGATQIGVEGVEADDVIAWLCEGINAPKQVFSVDEDMLQLVNDQTVVILKDGAHAPANEDIPGAVGGKRNIPYHLTSLAKSILGDTSDEYPGVRGLGPAKWDALLEAYGEDGMEELRDIVATGDSPRLDEVIEATQDKTLIKLRENFAEWRRMYRLARLHPELCWKPRNKKLVKPIIHKRVADADKVYALLKEIGAEDMWETFEPMTPRTYAVTQDNWSELKSAIFDEIRAGDVVAFDYETADKQPHQAFFDAASSDRFVDMLSHQLTGASFQFGRHLENSIYVSVDHKDAANLPRGVIAEILEFAAQHCQLVAQNFYFEGIISRTNLNLTLSNVHDTFTMQRFFDENGEAGLKAMSKHYLNYAQASYEETVGDKGHMANLTLDEVLQYGIDDSLVTGSLYDLLKVLLQVDGQWDFYTRWGVNASCVLQDSYIRGVDVNWDLQKRIHANDIKVMEESLAALRALLEEHAMSQGITAGCNSLIEEEKDFVYKSARRKFRDKDGLSGDELKSSVKSQVAKWQKGLETACQYVPFEEKTFMPPFKMTETQLTKAADAVGLPPISSLSHSFLQKYLGDHGINVWGVDPPTCPKQLEFLTALQKAVGDDAHRVKSLEKQAARAEEKGDADTADARYRDIEKAEQAIEELGEVMQRLAGVEPKAVKTGDELSLGSPQQMQKLLYCKIGVPVRLRSSGTLSQTRMKLGFRENGPATDEKAIETALANDVEAGSWQEEALRLLLRAKSSRTKITLYHNKYPLWKHPVDGRMHPTFTYCGTDTMRPTGSSPNMLQVSKKDKEMRQQFHGPSEDHVTVAIDYASQEIRIMACEAKDEVMIKVYDPADEKDLHSMTGSGIASMDYGEFIEAREDEEHKLHPLVEAVRKKAKGVNFGLAYGAGAGTLSRNLIVPLTEAKSLLEDTMALYWRIPQWQEETASFMNRHGFTQTAFGTKRHATDDLFSKDKSKVARQHRQGINATIQQTAADMLSIVLTKIWERGLLQRLDMVFFAPIYDEVVSFVHKDDVVEYCREMNDIMQSATPPGHEVPQVPEFSIGATWGTVKELGRWPGETAIQEATQKALVEAQDVWREAA